MTSDRLIPLIVVAGDVCIDWLSIPIESIVTRSDSRVPMNWQLRDGRHMYAQHGGAWLTAAFTKAAVGASARVIGQKPEPHPENVPPDDIIHSMLALGPSKEQDKKKVPHWVVNRLDGYAGPVDDKTSNLKGVEKDDRNAGIVLLDDAGNGFRDRPNKWPLALKPGLKPLVLYKVSRPLDKGPLWRRLKTWHIDRTIALLGADELRGEGGSINRELSWERSATDLLLTLQREPSFEGLRRCLFIIVTFGIEAAVLIRCADQRISGADLIYLPNLIEGGLLCTERGKMGGFGSAFAATIAAEIVRSGVYQSDSQPGEIRKALLKGAHKGLLVSNRLLEHAFGPCKMDDKKTTRPPQYPIKEIFRRAAPKSPKVFDVAIPKLRANRTSKELAAFRSWRILDSTRDVPFAELAEDVVRRGVEKVFPDVPIGQFGKLNTLDRSEIESYRSVRNLINEFLRIERPERPLCLAVFGAPGGGKSFGVTQVARSLDTEGLIDKLSFNVSQWNDSEYLVNALHRVRDSAIGGKVPLVFFDEFDSELRGQKLGWLKYFLEPMQDGVFADGLYTHTIGKAIFVFAGGTATTYAEFRAAVRRADAETKSLTEKDSSEKDDFKSAKLPDFDSRLRGYVDVFGLDPPTDTNLLRRALVLRSNIEKSHKTLMDADHKVRIDSGVLRAFLRAPSYYHGARSIEAILEMSRLGGRAHFDPSLLPPQHQLNLHVDGNAFMALVKHQATLKKPMIKKLAKQIHNFYVASELAEEDDDGNPIVIGAWPSLYYWNDLDEFYRRSSREQAAYYPTLLAAAGCSFEDGDPASDFKFSEKEINKLAQMEHERWVEERRIKQPDHADLVPWEELTWKKRRKDSRTIEAIPKFLGAVGLRIVRF